MCNSKNEASLVIPQEPSLSAQDEMQDDEEIWQDESDIKESTSIHTTRNTIILLCTSYIKNTM